MDIDDDFDLDIDPIKDFLTHKLEEIRTHNATLEKNMEDKTKLLSNHSVSAKPSLEITNVWSRIHNDRFTFGFYVTNTEDTCITISNILLNWNSSALITYQFAVYNINTENTSFEYAKNHRIAKKGCVILVIEKPIFLKQISFDITGRLIYGIAETKCDVTIPNFKITVDDFTSSDLEVKNSNLEDVLSVMASSCAYEMIGRDDVEGNKDLDRVFELDCMFEKLVIGDKKIFLVGSEVSRNLQGSLLEVAEATKGFIINFFCKDEDILVQCLHLLYKNIDCFSFLAKGYGEIVDNDQNITSKLSGSLLREIFLIKQCSNKNDTDRLSSTKFRNKLTDMQLETDLLYTKFLTYKCLLN